MWVTLMMSKDDGPSYSAIKEKDELKLIPPVLNNSISRKYPTFLKKSPYNPEEVCSSSILATYMHSLLIHLSVIGDYF